MEFLRNQKNLTAILIIVGLFLAGFNFFIFQNLNSENIFNYLQQFQGGAKAQVNPVLPDIKVSQPISQSKLRDSELNKIKPNLSQANVDQNQNFTINYYPQTKTLIVNIQANNIEEYRQRKVQAEEKLSEMGSTNLCSLAVFWAPPVTLNKSLEKSDLITSNCSG